MKLKEYIEQQIKTDYFSGLLERYRLANTFMGSFREQYCAPNSKNEKATAATVPFFNPDNIEIEEISSDQVAKRYVLTFPDTSVMLPKNKMFTNCSFADRRSLKCKPSVLSKKFHNSNNGDVAAFYRNKEAYIVSTLSVLLFYIYFGYHPLCGRDYYENANLSSHSKREFFSKKHDFIFKVEENKNRFINGYHSEAWTLWNALSDSQKAFWNTVFVGEVKTYADFYQKWENAYPQFVETTVMTPCGAKLNTIVFDETYALVTSDNTIGNKRIRCERCNQNLLNECEDCSVASAHRIAGLLMLNIKLVADQTGNGTAEYEEKEMVLYSGKTLYASDFSNTQSSDALFEVITSKKGDLLGLKYLSSIPLEVNYGSETKFYKKNATVALLPGIQINVVPEIYKIVVPGTPPEKDIPKPTEKALTVPTQTVQNPVPKTPTRQSPSDIAQVSASPKALDTTQAFPQKEEPAAANDANLIYTEGGNIYDVLFDKEIIEGKGYKIYTVRSRQQPKTYSLKLFDPPIDEQAKKNQTEIISNIKSMLAQKPMLPISLLYPKAIVLAKGFANNRIGYIYNELPNAAKPISDIINENPQQGFDAREIAALLDLFCTVKALHSKNMLYNTLELRNMHIDIDGGKCYLTDNESISNGPRNPAIKYLHLCAPEVVCGDKTDVLSDCYSLAVVAFMVLYKMHPYGKTLWRERQNSNPATIKEQYISNPQFFFDARRMGLPKPMALINGIPQSPVDDKWRNTPYYIRDLFYQTFGTPFCKDQNHLDTMRKKRPTVQTWCNGLSRWYNDLKRQNK